MTNSAGQFVTEEEVHSAADDLDRQGIKVGPRPVRELLRRGSFTTISKHLESWSPGSDETAVAQPCPREVLDAAARSAEQTWRLAAAAAGSLFGGQKADLEQQLADLESNLSEVSEDRKALVEENLGMLAQLEALTAEREKLKEHSANLAGQLTALKALSQPIKRKPGPKPGFKRTPKPAGATATTVPNS